MSVAKARSAIKKKKKDVDTQNNNPFNGFDFNVE